MAASSVGRMEMHYDSTTLMFALAALLLGAGKALSGISSIIRAAKTLPAFKKN
jgi:hypothetical protein